MFFFLEQATVGAGKCLEEGGDPLPHLSALDPLLAELTELETRVKKAPKEDLEDARCDTVQYRPSLITFSK